MVSNSDNWVRIFDISEVAKHKKGFTIYKVLSMLYPKTCPDAITKVTVWKRFNDFKKLHREMKVLHKKMNLKDKYPNLPTATFFKRFDEKTVQQRRQSILNFLEYVGEHSQLFASELFVTFFKSSHTPLEQINSNINSIRANLNLPEDPEYKVTNSDDEHTISDTDSVSTMNSSCLSLQLPPENKSRTSLMGASHHSRNSTDSLTLSTSSLAHLDGINYPTPPDTPGSCGSENSSQYLVDASLHFNIAVELENGGKYEEAFTAYKTAIDILLKYGKGDLNYERRQMVRYRTEKYLIRAEKIYNMHLSDEVRNLKQITGNEDNGPKYTVRKPISDLHKYKVVRVISSGMVVLHSELQQLFYIKVIHKTMKFLSDNLILPENVPYMVKLYNYYNCENALFLVLEYLSSGKRICDYIASYSDNPDNSSTPADNEPDNNAPSDSDEGSYSDLILSYAAQKTHHESDEVSDGSYEKVCLEEVAESPKFCKLKLQIDESEAAVLGAGGNNNVQSAQGGGGASFDDGEDEFEGRPGVVMPVKQVVRWAAQLVLALEKLHDLGVICRDLQPRNLLINENGHLNLTYMCNIDHMDDVLSRGHVPAPELLTFEPVTSALDWWNVGVILYELLVGTPLIVVHPEGLTSFTALKIPKHVCPEGKSLLKQVTKKIKNDYKMIKSQPKICNQLPVNDFVSLQVLVFTTQLPGVRYQSQTKLVSFDYFINGFGKTQRARKVASSLV